MKTKLTLPCFCILHFAVCLSSFAQGTAFTYQGRLLDNGVPANGPHSFEFRLRQTNNGSQQGPTLTTNGLSVSNGLFTVSLDFGDYFGTREFALEIGVRSNGSTAPFTILSPHQIITPTPLAIAANHAASAIVADTVLASGLPSSVPQLDANAQMRVNGSVVVGPDPLYTQGFENVGFPPSGWSTGGTANWTRTNGASSEGGFSAASGTIGPSQLSYLDFVYDFPTAMLVKFDWKVSSGLADGLHFCVDGDCDTAGVNPISGEVNWTPVTVSISPGIHTLRWMFVRGETGSGGSNRGWIDNVRLVATEGNLQVNGIVTALAFKGNGAGVSNVNASTLTGTLPDAQLPATAARRNSGNAFTGNQTIAGTVGIGTVNPQGSVHIYSANNPTTMRIQSSGAPGFGRVEFVSNPQGDVNEWRPGYIQSTDNGGFVGGLAFFVNGAGAGNKFGSNEVMRIVNGAVGIGTTAPQAPLHVWGRAIVNGSDFWDVNNTEGDFRVGSATHRFKIGVAQVGGGAGDVWMRAHGGTARLFVKTPGGTTFFSNEGQSTGVTMAPGGGSWTALSDRNAKENFRPVKAVEVLEKVAALPLSTWNYKSQDARIQHLGPMAQDFKAAFGLGESDTGITTVDADGVALAAIQGLNQKTEARSQKSEIRIQKLEAENAELKSRLAALEEIVTRFTRP